MSTDQIVWEMHKLNIITVDELREYFGFSKYPLFLTPIPPTPEEPPF